MTERSDKNRVVITGMGIISPLGNTVTQFWESLVSGKSGIDYISTFDTENFPTKIAGEARDFRPEDYLTTKQIRRQDRFSQLATAAAQDAVKHSGLDLEREDKSRIAVVIGNGNGGFGLTAEQTLILHERGWSKVSPTFIPRILPNMASANVAIEFELQGYNSTVVTACAAGTQAIGDAAEIIRSGRAEIAVTGGTEAGISPIGLAGFCAMRALSTSNDDPQKASRPFDLNRDGFVPGEGAGILILERLDRAKARGAPMLAEILGSGASSDARDLVQPDSEGAGAAQVIEWTLQDARIQATDVDYINAHGTSTQLNDASETQAIKRAFGDIASSIPISSTKSMIGHGLGAAGGMEAVVAVQSIQTNTRHPTTNYENPDPACDLDYVPGEARSIPVRNVLSNSFGFGGQNACVLFGAVDN